MCEKGGRLEASCVTASLFKDGSFIKQIILLFKDMEFSLLETTKE